MFGMLVDKYQEAFLRKAAYILHSHDAAEDAVQETFLKIYKYTDQFSERRNASFSSWAYKILVNHCISQASGQARRSTRIKVLDFENLDALGGADNLTHKEQVSLVHSVLARLPARLSRMLSLYFLEDKSYAEIAIAEHVSLSTVRSGLHRAKQQFKNIAVEIL